MQDEKTDTPLEGLNSPQTSANKDVETTMTKILDNDDKQTINIEAIEKNDKKPSPSVIKKPKRSKVVSFQHLHSASAVRRYQHVTSKVGPYIADMMAVEERRIENENLAREQAEAAAATATTAAAAAVSHELIENAKMNEAEFLAVVNQMRQKINDLQSYNKYLQDRKDAMCVENCTTRLELNSLRFKLHKCQRELDELVGQTKQFRSGEKYVCAKPFWQMVLDESRNDTVSPTKLVTNDDKQQPVFFGRANAKQTESITKYHIKSVHAHAEDEDSIQMEACGTVQYIDATLLLRRDINDLDTSTESEDSVQMSEFDASTDVNDVTQELTTDVSKDSSLSDSEVSDMVQDADSMESKGATKKKRSIWLRIFLPCIAVSDKD